MKLLAKVKSAIGAVGKRAKHATLALFVVGTVATPAFASGGSGSFSGVTQAQIDAVYQGVLNQVGIWVAGIFGILAVLAGVVWIIGRMTRGSGVK